MSGGISMILIGIANSIELVMVFIFLAGFTFSGFEILCLVYTSEISGIIYPEVENNNYR